MAEKIKFPEKMAKWNLGFVLWQITNIWERKLNSALRNINLTHVQFALLSGIAELIKSESPVTQIKLARYTNTNVMMASKVLRKMEQKKLIERKQDTVDTRQKCLSLTETGIKTVNKAFDIVSEINNKFFYPIEGDFDNFIEYLDEILDFNKE